VDWAQITIKDHRVYMLTTVYIEGLDNIEKKVKFLEGSCGINDTYLGVVLGL
jgi:hypothetical protein